MNDIESIGMSGSGSKMPHSHSTPAGVDGGSRTPPTTPRKAGKMLAVRVQMLDDTVTMFQVQAKALGRVLFDQVCKQLHLLEADYFGLEYQEPNGTKYWLDLEKPVCRQVGLTLVDPLLRFCVKFYTPDPAQLEEEFTRYLFCLQIKRDLAQGLLQCNDNTAALMASYIVQAECGDYVIEDYPDHTYLSTYKFVPHQDQELERRIMENHKKHAGQSPAEADLNLLETARRCELYGMKMHPAKDHEGEPLNLAVAHMGIVVFQNYTKINTFSWAKIRKISFKRKRFLIKLHPEGYGYYKDTVEFFFEGRNECKNFWKKCVENHGFFRCSAVKRVVRQKTRVLSRGSSFRYSGKTQKQIVEFVRDNYVKRQTFQRSNSFRQTSSGRALQGSEGGGYRGATPSSSLMGSSSISAHPLLPLGDPALATPALSLSCGSMTLDSPTTATSVSMGGTGHRRDDTATSFRTLTSIDVHSPATPSQAPVQRQHHATSQQRISSTGRISPSNSSPPEFPPPRPMPRHPWQRSASCRELYASSFEDSGRARQRRRRTPGEHALQPFQLPSQGELDNPVTRYDESNRSYSAASSKLPSLDHDSVPEKVYSSSYPGTSSLSTESGHEESGPAGDLSHDDLSHDSYELLEREHEFEYPESYSSPRDENEPVSENSDEGIEHEMFQMDSETDSFVKHRSVKSSDKQHFKSVLADLKNIKTKSIDRHSAAVKSDGDYVVTESRIQRSNTQIERKFETRHANSVEFPSSNKNPIPHLDPNKKDPLITQVQKQKLTLLNELRNFKPKYKITHVDSEVLRDEGIMRPKSRIDDDLSPLETERTILDQGVAGTGGERGRTTRAKSIASLEDHSARPYVETGSLGWGHKSRERKTRETEAKMLLTMQQKEQRSLERDERKRMERENSREARRSEKIESKERKSMDRVDSRERKSTERLDSRDSGHSRRGVDRHDSRELRKSIERLDSRERSFHRNDPQDSRGKSVERLDLRTSTENLEKISSSRETTPRQHHRYDSWERRERSTERLDSRESRRSPLKGVFDYEHRHTLERFDSGNRSPFERVSSREPRGKSAERLDSREMSRPTFDFDPRTIERLSSMERHNSKERVHDRRIQDRRSIERKSLEKLDSRERKSLEKLDSRERKSLEKLDSRERKSLEKLDSRERKSLEKLDSRERKSLERLDSSEHKSPEKLDFRERRSFERLDLVGSEALRRSVERLDYNDTRRSKGNLNRKPERGKSDEKPRERDDWRSLEKAKKDDERRERDRQAKLSLETRTDTVIGIPNEMDNARVTTVFTEYDPKVIAGVVFGFDDTALASHIPVERTKSDPNPSRQRLGSNSKRHMLTHQKSIDLTPADSGDEDPFSDGICSAQKANVDIPYTLHKRHVMNGTASDEKSESDSGKTSKRSKELPKLPLKMVTDVSCLDLTKLPASKVSPEKSKSILISPDKPKTVRSPSNKPKSILSPTSKLSPTDHKSIASGILSPTEKSPLKSSLKPQSHNRVSSKSNSLERVKSDSSLVDRMTAKSASLDKKTLKSLITETTDRIERKSPKVSPKVSPKASPKVSPVEPNVTIVSVLEKQRSPDPKEKSPLNFAAVVGMEIKQELERREKEKLKVPDDSLEKQDSIEKIPLPEIPVKVVETREKPPIPAKQKRPNVTGERPVIPEKPPLPPKISGKGIVSDRHSERRAPESEKIISRESTSSSAKQEVPPEKPKIPEKPKTLEKPSIPEKTKRILDRIESRFSEVNKNSPTKISKPKIIDTGFDDFVDPVAELPLDEVPVKPALELDSLKVPEFTPFMLRLHAEPLRSKSLSLAEEKASIDTLLSPEVESKSFVQDISPKRAKKAKSESKKDFKKQSKSLEADKPPLKKGSSKESKMSPSNSKIDKSKLKLGEMPQEIIIIDSTDVVPEISIVQKGRSKSVTRLSDRSFSTSREEKDEVRKPRAKSASVDDELIKGAGSLKGDKPRPKSLGISKSLGSTEKKDSLEKVSPKRAIGSKSVTKTEVIKLEDTGGNINSNKWSDSTSPKPEIKSADSRSDGKSDSDADQVPDVIRTKLDRMKDAKKCATNTQQELIQSPVMLRKPGQSPVLFARARLGLSEGSGMGALQRQGATQSPTAQRRAKSLDAPIISVHRLPPANAFSSKDDTVDMTEESEDRDNTSDDNIEFGQGSKPQSIQMEASPNHKSDSTDHTTVPEICTDSLSVTETSAQYLESPLTECNEIVTCPDLIPYEQERQLTPVGQSGSKDVDDIKESVAKVGSESRFIDQSSIESAGTDQDAAEEKISKVKSDVAEKNDSSPRSRRVTRTATRSSSKEKPPKVEVPSGTDGSEGERRERSGKVRAQERNATVAGKKSNNDVVEVGKKSTAARLEDQNDLTMPVRSNTTDVTLLVLSEDNTIIRETDSFDWENKQDIVRSPIQISIEECSDEEVVNSDEKQDDVPDEEDQLEIGTKRRLDSGDTSEDTLDALDTQVQIQGGDSELSSPDYGIEKMDEKTLVEVELTPEYLEMKKEEEDEEVAEDLPEDEPPVFKESKNDATDNNRLTVDKKLRLSTERSRSEDTNTWTPDREDPDSSSCSIARPLGIGQIQPIIDCREIAMIRETRKEGSVEEESLGSNGGPHQRTAKVELSSTWKPFPLESSGSSSLEEGWFPPDDNNQHHQSQSEDSNGQNEDSFQEDLADFPSGFGYPMGPEILANYGCAFSLSRTLSRISERSTTSEQDKSDLEDSFKPSSRSPSLDDESLMSSDHQPSLSSDPPSGTALPSVSDDRRTSSELPDIPIDIINAQEEGNKSPRIRSKLQLQASEDWPSPPSSPLFDTPVVSHVETFYMEIKPEEAIKVTVTDSTDTPPERVGHGDSDSSDDNRTLHDDLHSTLLEDAQSSASATTVDGTVKIAVKPKSNSYITGSSHSEDTSMGLSMSEWSSSNNTVRQFCQYSGTKSDDNSLAELGASISDWSGSTTVIPQQYYSAIATEKSQSDTTTSDKSVTSMRPNSKCQHVDSPPPPPPPVPRHVEQSGSVGSGQLMEIDDASYDENQSRYARRKLEEVHVDSGDYEEGDEAAQFEAARKFVEKQFDEVQSSRPMFSDISPPQITFRNEYDETVAEVFDEADDQPSDAMPDIPRPIPEEDEEEQLYDNVPAMKYSSGDQVRMEVTRGDSSEDMHERYAGLASGNRYEYEGSFEDQRTLEESLQKRFQEKPLNRFERGYSEPAYDQKYGTKSTVRPVIVPVRAKSTPYYSTTSLSGESTTSSPPMQVKAQIRTKTMTYSSSRSPQSEGDTSSSMDSPGHTPERGPRAFRRKRQQNVKRRHRVVVDMEVKGGQIVSSTDSSFDVASIPPPLLPEQSIDIDDDDLSDSKNNGQRQQQHR